jgi:predicted RNA-binding protein with PUA-like domain
VAYWLMKSEPDSYAWDDLVRDGGTRWDGVHNHQAAANMRAMAVGDRVLFYRSQKDPAVVGIMEIERAAYEDSEDPAKSYVLVDVKPVMPVESEVSLRQIKADSRLAHLPLVRQSRLSVSAIDREAWAIICGMAGVEG